MLPDGSLDPDQVCGFPVAPTVDYFKRGAGQGFLRGWHDLRESGHVRYAEIAARFVKGRIR